MRRWFTLISALLIISSGTVAQSPQQSWPPTLVWSASSFECPAVDTKRKIEDAELDGDAGAQTQFRQSPGSFLPGVEESRRESAIPESRREKNNIEAQITLGDIFRDGNAVPKDLFQATKWFARAAAKATRAPRII